MNDLHVSDELDARIAENAVPFNVLLAQQLAEPGSN
jgi:hypothetical protein